MNITGTLQLGFIYSFLTLGVFISFRVMNTPDLTADGSFTLGMAISSVATVAGYPVLGLFLGLIAGSFAGVVTGLLQTKAGIHPLLAGILTMTGLYSINLFIMGGSPNLSLLGRENLFTLAQARLPSLDRNSIRLCLLFLISLCFIGILTWFFKTGMGLRLRATGNNEQMVRSSSLNTDLIKISACAIANALISFSGAILAQYQGYGDINAGTGIVIIGLASVILGELFPYGSSMGRRLLSVTLGALVYRFLIAVVLYLNIFPAYMLRLLSALIVAIALALPRLRLIYDQYRTRKRKSPYA